MQLRSEIPICVKEAILAMTDLFDKSPLSACLGLLLATLIFITIVATENESSLGVSNLVVPDGQSYAIALTELGKPNVSWKALLGTDCFGVPTNAIFYAIHYPFHLSLGLTGSFVLNAIALVIIVRVIGVSVFLLIPYFLLSCALPSKDIAVLLCFAMFCWLVIRKHLITALFLIPFTYFIRDGAGVILMGVYISYLLRMSLRVPLLSILGLIFVCAVVASCFLEHLEYISIVSRNMEVAGSFESAGDPFQGSPPYIARLFATLTNLAFRPAIFDEQGGFAVLGFAYWVSGVALLTVAFVSVVRYRRIKQHSELELVLLLFIVSLLVVAVNPHIQPRYQMPALACALPILRNINGVKAGLTFLLTALLAVTAAFVYYTSPLGLPPPYESGNLLAW